jgi:hypothetical protein
MGVCFGLIIASHLRSPRMTATSFVAVDPQTVEDVVFLRTGHWSDDSVTRVLGKLKADEHPVPITWAAQG